MLSNKELRVYLYLSMCVWCTRYKGIQTYLYKTELIKKFKENLWKTTQPFSYPLSDYINYAGVPMPNIVGIILNYFRQKRIIATFLWLSFEIRCSSFTLFCVLRAQYFLFLRKWKTNYLSRYEQGSRKFQRVSSGNIAISLFSHFNSESIRYTRKKTTHVR